MTITHELTFTAPLHADALVGHFAARAVAGIESVLGDTYTRSLSLPGGPGVVALRIGSERVVAELALLDARDVRTVLGSRSRSREPRPLPGDRSRRTGRSCRPRSPPRR